MRKPMLAKVFGVEETPGLTDILLGNYPWRDTVTTITDVIMGKMILEEVMFTPGLDNLHFITGGLIPPNPAELVESKNLTDFIAESQKGYDLIIFDTSPIVFITDAVIMGAKVNGVLMVYRLGGVSKSLLKRAIAQLAQVNCHIVGGGLNGTKPEISPDFQDAKYYKSYYSYGEEDKNHRITSTPKEFLFSQKNLKSLWKSKYLSGLMTKNKKLFQWLIFIALICLVLGVLKRNGIFNIFKFFICKPSNVFRRQRACLELSI